MYSVFSNYLEPLQAGVRTKPTKPSEIYNQLRIAYNQGVEGIIDSTRFFVSDYFEDEVDYDILYKSWESDKFRYLIRWVNKNITLKMGIDNYITLSIRLRIATSMLNKLVEESEIPKKMAIIIHDNLAFNVRRETSLILDEDLPF